MTQAGGIDWSTVKAAFDFALEEQADQARKGTDVPYTAHLWGVASLVISLSEWCVVP